MYTDRPPLKDIVYDYLNPSHAVSLLKYRMRKETSQQIEESKEEILQRYKKSKFTTSLKKLLASDGGTFLTHECQVDELENPFLMTLNGTIKNGHISCVETRTPVPPASVFLEHLNKYEQWVYKIYYDYTGAAPLCYKSHTWKGDVMFATFGSAPFNLLGDKPIWNVEEVYRIDIDDPATHVYLGDRTVMAAFIEHFPSDPDTSPSVSSSSALRPTVGGKSPRSHAALSQSLPTVAGKSPRPSVSFSEDGQTRRCGKAPVLGYSGYNTEAIEDGGSEDDESDVEDDESDVEDDESDVEDDESDVEDDESDVEDDESDVEEDESETMEEDESVGSPTHPQTGVKSPVVLARMKRSHKEEKKDPTWSPDRDNEEEVTSPLPRYTRRPRPEKRKGGVLGRQLGPLHARKRKRAVPMRQLKSQHARKRKRAVPMRQLKSQHARKKNAHENSCLCSECVF
jgi:hypothetical protein